MAAYGDYQNEIYFNGLRGVKPKLPVDFRLLEARAAAALPQSVISYVAGRLRRRAHAGRQRRSVPSAGA